MTFGRNLTNESAQLLNLSWISQSIVTFLPPNWARSKVGDAKVASADLNQNVVL